MKGDCLLSAPVLLIQDFLFALGAWILRIPQTF